MNPLGAFVVVALVSEVAGSGNCRDTGNPTDGTCGTCSGADGAASSFLFGLGLGFAQGPRRRSGVESNGFAHDAGKSRPRGSGSNLCQLGPPRFYANLIMLAI